MKVLLLLLSLTILSISCVKDVDVKQYEEAAYSINMELPLLKEDLNQDDFLDDTNTIVRFSRVYLSGLDGIFYKNEKDSIHHTITISNSFLDRPIFCYFFYKDEFSNSLPLDYTITIPRNTLKLKKEIIYEGVDYDNFIKAKYIELILKIGTSNQIIPPPLNGEFHLQSIIGFKLESPFLSPPPHE